ncbi:GNAT family N-acetyltransferase [Nonomuraea rubra]|uniref:GNAT superfamily N-acetyltransferase n=1 Tax=Nonomuraea rubra TaxID=46180 RepID=A0A7X0NYG3_9ACTN|nr:GNAT family N-acetyltransferase [Nonomuraea rubra]MBB6551952.1 GNAT superfamily N-acetyltransferase [Nonomuraea rubra]
MDELARGPALERGGAAADLARALAFLQGFARRRAPVVVPVEGGFGVLDERFPGSYDDNKLIVTAADPAAGRRTAAADPGAVRRLAEAGDPEPPGRLTAAGAEGLAGRLMAAADEVLAGRDHRLVCVDDDRLGEACAPAFDAAGYEHETNLVMAFRGEIPPDPPPAERLTLAELEPVLRRDWRRTLPQAPAEVIDGLARRVESRLRGADTVGFRGVRTPSGEIAARADLYAHGGVAQIESVFTGEEHRGKGYARALMNALLAEAAGAELVFLVADAGDWPRHFYGRLGFEEVGRTHSFLRT